MGYRRVVATVVTALTLVVGSATSPPPAAASPAGHCSVEDLHGDARLGPADLPTRGAVGLELRGYDRLAGLTSEQFIATYWDDTANGGQGGWRYPPFDGFLLDHDGQPIEEVTRVHVGQRLDRYGSEFGAFLAPTGSPYASRAIPPQSLDNATDPGGCNYRAYRVVRDFDVSGGPVAPAFGQPGMGTQYLLDASLVPGAPVRLTVLWLVDNGYLQRCVIVISHPFSC